MNLNEPTAVQADSVPFVVRAERCNSIPGR